MNLDLRLNQGVWYQGKPYKISGIKTLTYTLLAAEDSKILYVDLAGIDGGDTLYYDIDPLQLSRWGWKK